MSYGAVHRFFLRTVASQGMLTVSKANEILKKYFPGEGTISIEQLVHKINEKIIPFKQKIMIVTHEVTTEQCVVFLCIGFDDATKSQTIFSAPELDFFRLLIEQIMTTESRQITLKNALNLVNNLKLSKIEAQKLLDTWCRTYYLEETNLNYALGIRAIHEFRGYLRDNMPDTINECSVCTENVFRGYNCPACEKATHTRCLKIFLQNAQKWPCCSADFRQEQLDRLNSGGFSETQTQTQKIEVTQVTERHNGFNESIQCSDDNDDFDRSQSISLPSTSQMITRKRKRSHRD